MLIFLGMHADIPWNADIPEFRNADLGAADYIPGIRRAVL